MPLGEAENLLEVWHEMVNPEEKDREIPGEEGLIPP